MKPHKMSDRSAKHIPMSHVSTLSSHVLKSGRAKGVAQTIYPVRPGWNVNRVSLLPGSEAFAKNNLKLNIHLPLGLQDHWWVERACCRLAMHRRKAIVSYSIPPSPIIILFTDGMPSGQVSGMTCRFHDTGPAAVPTSPGARRPHSSAHAEEEPLLLQPLHIAVTA